MSELVVLFADDEPAELGAREKWFGEEFADKTDISFQKCEDLSALYPMLEAINKDGKKAVVFLDLEWQGNRTNALSKLSEIRDLGVLWPVILYSSSTLPDEVEKAYSARANAYVPKAPKKNKDEAKQESDATTHRLTSIDQSAKELFIRTIKHWAQVPVLDGFGKGA